MVKEFTFETAQKCWEEINEYFILNPEEIEEKYGYRNSSQLIGYNFWINILHPYLNPEFDFNKYFNYTKSKWVTLVNNYVDLNYLDIFKSEIRTRERKSNKNYNVSYLFSNTHIHGKGCLLTLTISRRAKEPFPRLILQLRSSEIVKRLLFDLTLIKNIGEYILGEIPFLITLILPNCFTQSEVSCMYLVYKPELIELIKDKSKESFSSSIYNNYLKLKSNPLDTIKYKIHQRAAKVIQDNTLKKPLLLKNLTLIKDSNI